MTRVYAICTKEAHERLKNCFHPQYGSHYIDLPDGRILLMANFNDEAGEVLFTSDDQVETLPDPYFAGNQPLEAKHLSAVAHLGLEGNTVLHLARAAGKMHPLMKLRPWM